MILMRQSRRNAVKIAGERGAVLDQARGRIVMMSCIFIVLYVLMAGRAFDLSVIQSGVGEDAQVLLDQSFDGPEEKIAARRGDVYDRNGILLATTLQTASLYADPYLISDPKAAAQGLVEIFPDLKYGDILQKLQSKKRFLWVKRQIMPEDQARVLKLGEPGLVFEYEYKRIYPQGAQLAHLLGYTNIDNTGLAGLERGFNSMLASGQDLKLTVDMRLQHALRREMQKVIKDFSAIGGAGVVLDVTNGDILAGVSLPDFDPHDAGTAESKEVFNRLTLGVYELGSVFKIFSTAAFLETHDVPMSTTFDASEPIKVGRFTINDYHAEDRILTIPEVFMYSSNIGSAMMGQAVGTDVLRSFYDDLGLLRPLDFEVREVAQPLVPQPWREVNTLTASYGHGLATTPLQTALAAASIVNGGTLVKPSLILNGNVAPSDLRVVSETTAHRMRQLLRLVVTDGTGSKADVPGYRVGGKTGTAEKIAGRGYDQKKLISSFIAAFPIDAPRYLVFIAIDEPKGTKASFGYATGGWVAAPAVARVITAMGSILGLAPHDLSAEREISAPLKQFVAAKEKR